MKIYRSTLASCVFVLALVLFYYVHINFLRVDVVFYAAIADGILASCFTLAILLVVPYFYVFSKFEKFLLFLVWIITSYAVAISGPAVIDRSLSFYILEKLEQRGGGILQSRFEDVFVKEYLVEHRLVDVRLTEQLESGTIEIKEGCVLLTDKGRSLVGFSRAFRTNWLPKQRLLMGEYSDDLTDPFRESIADPDYKCSEG